jgi:hypothetical protein
VQVDFFKYLNNLGNMVGMDKSDMDMDIDMDNPGMDMDMDMLDMDMDSKAVHINKGLQQQKAADCSLHHVQSDETRHALGSHDDQDHRILAQHDRDQYDQVLRFPDRHDRDLRRELHLLVDEILALLVSSSSKSLTFLYS